MIVFSVFMICHSTVYWSRKSKILFEKDSRIQDLSNHSHHKNDSIKEGDYAGESGTGCTADAASIPNFLNIAA